MVPPTFEMSSSVQTFFGFFVSFAESLLAGWSLLAAVFAAVVLLRTEREPAEESASVGSN